MVKKLIKNFFLLIYGIMILIYTVIIELPITWVMWHCSKKFRIYVWKKNTGKKWQEK